MNTTQIAAALYQLQQLDFELERLAAEQQTIDGSLQENTALTRLRLEQRAMQQQLRSALQTQKDAEYALDELSHRLQTQEPRLYSGMVHTPKELHALQQEVQHLRTQVSRQEEVALEAMEATELLQKQVQRATTALKEAEATWTRESGHKTMRREQLEEKRREIQAKRTKVVSTLDASYVSRYEAMRRTKQGRAVSKVEQNSCQWCRVILTPSELQHVRTSASLQTCTNCGRILYYDR